MDPYRASLYCAALALCACHGDSGVPAQKTYHFTPRKGPTASEQTRGMVDAAIVGKSELAVVVKFDLKQRPMLGQPVSIDVAVLPGIDGSAANLAVNGGDSLAVAPESGAISLAAVAAGQVYRQTVVVTPKIDGVLVLSLRFSIQHDDVTESRAFSIPLIVDPQIPPTASN